MATLTPTPKQKIPLNRQKISEAGVSTFIELTDVPSSYTGEGDKFVKVNTGETALEFQTISGGGDMLAATYDPTSVAGDAFHMDNMAQGSTNLFVSTGEQADFHAPGSDDQDLSDYQLEPAEGAFQDGDKTKLDGIEAGAEVNVAESDPIFITGGQATTGANWTTGLREVFDSGITLGVNDEFVIINTSGAISEKTMIDFSGIETQGKRIIIYVKAADATYYTELTSTKFWANNADAGITISLTDANDGETYIFQYDMGIVSAWIQLYPDKNIPVISDVAYDAGTWDNNTDGASKNAIRDQVETMLTSIGGKQATLVSGTNIKTVNSTTLLGSGDLNTNNFAIAMAVAL